MHYLVIMHSKQYIYYYICHISSLRCCVMNAYLATDMNGMTNGTHLGVRHLCALWWSSSFLPMTKVQSKSKLTSHFRDFVIMPSNLNFIIWIALLIHFTPERTSGSIEIISKYIIDDASNPGFSILIKISTINRHLIKSYFSKTSRFTIFVANKRAQPI